jgi:DNA-binding NtrC family response regulator
MASQLTILVVEDELGVMAAICEVLSSHGYRLITAATLQEANKVLQRCGHTEIALVISDIHLTRNLDACEGYALYQRCAATHPGLPFILISAYPQSRDLSAIGAQTVRFLEKPFELADLLQCVREGLQQAIVNL